MPFETNFSKYRKHKIAFSSYVKIIKLHLVSAYFVPGTDYIYYVYDFI